MSTIHPRRRDLIEIQGTLGNAIGEADQTKKKNLLENARETLKPHSSNQPELALHSKVLDLIERFQSVTPADMDTEIRRLLASVNAALSSRAIPGGRRKKTARRRKRSHRKTRSYK